MFLLILYSFLAGIITVLSPCILPILPIVLSNATVTGTGKSRRPFGIIVGFIASFTFFTLFLSSIVKATNIPADFLRNSSIVIIALLGLSLISSRFQVLVEKAFSFFANKINTNKNTGAGFGSGFLVGLSLGLLWTPCVGPILASVITLAISGQVTLSAFFITMAYATGTAIPMFIILNTGRRLFDTHPWIIQNTTKIQKVFGFITIFLSLSLYLNWDRSFQSYILDKFPNYGTNLTKIEGLGDTSLITKNHQKLDILGKSPEIIAEGEWFNSDPLKISDLKGKVVLVDFWTYTCINCIRTLPYLRNWNEKYEDQGLVIIGVHSPEFEFEKDADNVQQAIKDFGLEYAIVQDNNFSTWKNFQNSYWPAKYLIDGNGNVRYTHFGEGDYDETELAIQDLLKELGANPTENVNNQAPAVNYAQTRETYLGYGRGDVGFTTSKEKYQTFTVTKDPSSNQVSYNGNWLFSKEYAQSDKDSEMLLNFSAKDVFLVMSPVEENASVQVYLDNILQDTLIISKKTVYPVLKLESPGRHILKLKFIDNKVRSFAFTFG